MAGRLAVPLPIGLISGTVSLRAWNRNGFMESPIASHAADFGGGPLRLKGKRLSIA